MTGDTARPARSSRDLETALRLNLFLHFLWRRLSVKYWGQGGREGLTEGSGWMGFGGKGAFSGQAGSDLMFAGNFSQGSRLESRLGEDS